MQETLLNNERKPLVKGLKINVATLDKKVEVLAKLISGDLAGTELNTLVSVIQYSTNNSLFITPDISKHIKKEYGIGQSAFSTSLFRLKKKGIIKMDGKTITIHPIFTSVISLDKLVISFV